MAGIKEKLKKVHIELVNYNYWHNSGKSNAFEINFLEHKYLVCGDNVKLQIIEFLEKEKIENIINLDNLFFIRKINNILECGYTMDSGKTVRALKCLKWNNGLDMKFIDALVNRLEEYIDFLGKIEDWSKEDRLIYYNFLKTLVGLQNSERIID